MTAAARRALALAALAGCSFDVDALVSGNATAAGDDPCAVAVDLDVMGARVGDTVRLATNNRAVSAGPTRWIPCARGMAGYVRAFRYTPRATTRLRVSTHNPGTTANLDTAIWAQTACDPVGSLATNLGCNDDVNNFDPQSEFVTFPVRAGVPVFVMVSGFLSATTGQPTAGHVTQGDVELTVTELPTRVDGQPCDAAASQAVCADGLACLDGNPSVCRAAPYAAAATSDAFVDACALGQSLALVDGGGGDDNRTVAAAAVPFAATFYGAPVRGVWPSVDGYATLDGVMPRAMNFQSLTRLPIMGEGALVAPFYSDLLMIGTSSICAATVGAAPARRFAVEWKDVALQGDEHPSVRLSFEVVLHEDTRDVDFLYQQLDPAAGPDAAFAHGVGAVVGVQGAGTSPAITHQPLVSTQSGVRFSPR